MPNNPVDDLPEIRPHIGGRRGQIPVERVPGFRSSLLRRLGRDGLNGAVAGNRSHAIRRAADVRAPASQSRRCVVKAHYFPMNERGRKAARLHLAYIERDGVEQDGSPGRLYGANEAFDREELAALVPAEKRQFRLIVSPEDGASLDLRAYTRELMTAVEGDLGRKLIWAAVNHHDTDNPHVHVVVRGVDASGQELRINGQYLSRDLRWRAQAIATRELGPRSEVEVAQQRGVEINLERFTSIDRMLAEHVTGDLLVGLDTLAGAPRSYGVACLARLQTLERLQLARKYGPGKWLLAPNWKESLTELGERGDVIKRIHKALRGRAVTRYQQIDPARPFVPFEGVIRAKGLHDELAGTFFGVVETLAGEAKYLRLPDDEASRLKEGDIVRIGAEAESWVKSTDKILARHAASHDGIYDPTLHLRELQALSKESRPAGAPSPADLITANERRLERLEKYGLVARVPGGRWRIPQDLIESLTRRAATHPRARLKIEQLGPALASQPSYAGPTWLDRQPVVDTARAPFGFGAEVSRAARLREVHMRNLGFPAPGDPRCMAALEALERETLGKALAGRRGMTYDSRPARMEGRLSTCDRLPSGAAYVQIVDEGERRLTVLPAPANARDIEGDMVEVELDKQGRAIVRQARSREK